jgi:starch synthase
LQHRLGLRSAPDAFLLGVIGRLSRQKGLDLLLENLPTILGEGMQLAVLGSGGDRSLQSRYRAAAQANPERVSVTIGHDEGLGHLIQAGADALVVPSRFEPCGLTQLCALRYGTVPIVSRVGGLEDTVVDAGDLAIGGRQTGFKFGPVTSENLAGVLKRARATFHDVAAWRRIQRNGMSIDVSWRSAARCYADLYSALVDLPQEKVA